MGISTEIVLQVDNVSKLYARNIETTHTRVRKTLLRAMTKQPFRAPETAASSEFWALRNISFTLKRGETLGIIGLNGSGKTTLLRMLGGQILPDNGEIRRIGKTAAMIDLTAGFQTSASGYENIFLRGAALGWDRKQMEALSAEIMEFADIGDAINAPVATYSSGMIMRLAFSIMIAVTADILLIDEILAVGDFEFRQKCLAKIRKMRDQAAFVLVSHNMGDISRFCGRVMVLNRGQVAFVGKPDEAIERYENLRPGNTDPINPIPDPDSSLGPQYQNDHALSELDYFWADKDGSRIKSIESGSDLYFHISFRSEIDIRNLVIGIPVWTEEGVYVTGFSNEITMDKFELIKGQRIKLRLEIDKLPFNPGYYVANLTIMDGPEYLYRKEIPALTVTKRSRFSWGVVTIPHQWNQETVL